MALCSGKAIEMWLCVKPVPGFYAGVLGGGGGVQSQRLNSKLLCCADLWSTRP